MTKDIVKYLLASVVLFFGTSVAAAMQDEPVVPENKQDAEQRRFEEADQDNNGSISRKELKAYVDEKLPGFDKFEQLVKRLDSNKNGSISNDEFAKRRAVAKSLEDQPKEFIDIYNERFLDGDPKLGSKIEKLVAFDENGKALNFESLKGKHTVITFGCLT